VAEHTKPKPRRSGGNSAPKRRAPSSRVGKGDQPDGPHGRLGVLWAAVTAAALLAGPLPLAAWMAAHAGLAAAQAARSHQPARSSAKAAPKAHPVGAAFGAVLLALSCAFGWLTVVIGLVLAAVGSVSLPTAIGETPAQPVTTALIAVAAGASAGSLVLARWMGVVPGLFLFALVCAYDMGAYLIGTGAHNRWEGPAAGIAAIGPVTLGAAAGAVPPFTDLGPAVIGVMAAVLAPLGPVAANRLLGPRAKTGPKRIRQPALRRLDSLLLLGPAYVMAARLFRA
jgi:CDP-diglyceride synthetase